MQVKKSHIDYCNTAMASWCFWQSEFDYWSLRGELPFALLAIPPDFGHEIAFVDDRSAEERLDLCCRAKFEIRDLPKPYFHRHRIFSSPQARKCFAARVCRDDEVVGIVGSDCDSRVAGVDEISAEDEDFRQ